MNLVPAILQTCMHKSDVGHGTIESWFERDSFVKANMGLV